MTAKPTALRLLAVWLLFMTTSVPLAAFEVEDVRTLYRDGEYRLEMRARLTAPAPRVEVVIRDYARYAELDGRILEARVLEREPGRVVLFTRLNACVGFFCRKVDRVEEVRERAGELEAITVPERSDVQSGRTYIRLEADGDDTVVHYESSIKPDFWVPPWFGRNWMLRTLQDATTALFLNVETRARQLGAVAEPSR